MIASAGCSRWRPGMYDEKARDEVAEGMMRIVNRLARAAVELPGEKRSAFIRVEIESLRWRFEDKFGQSPATELIEKLDEFTTAAVRFIEWSEDRNGNA